MRSRLHPVEVSRIPFIPPAIPKLRASPPARTPARTCVYAFDVFELQGRDLRDQALVQRRARLQALLARAKSNRLRFNESFPDADASLTECSPRGLEGLVAKRKDAPYQSGMRSGRIKVKTSEWKVANRYRAKLFEKSTDQVRVRVAAALGSDARRTLLPNSVTTPE